MTEERSTAPPLGERLAKIRTLDGSTRTATPPVPRSAKIELSARCDLHCFFCASHKRPRVQRDMPQALFARLCDELRAAGVEQLGLFYIGESMLCEWLPEAIRHAKEVSRFPYVFLTTNGLAATPDRLRACMAAGLDSVKFAFNWSDDHQFERATGLPAVEYELVLANLKWARSTRDDVQHETGHRCAVYASSLVYDDEQPTRMREALKTIEACVNHHYWLPLLGHCGLPGPALTGRPVPVKTL